MKVPTLRSWESPPSWQADPLFTFGALKSNPSSVGVTPPPDIPTAASVALSISGPPAAELSTPKVSAKPFARYPSPEATDTKFQGFRTPLASGGKIRPSPIPGDLLQRIQERIPPALMRVDESPVRAELPEEAFRVSPAAQRRRRYDPPSYRLDPLLATPVKPQFERRENPPPRKKPVKMDALKWEEAEQRMAAVKGEIRVGGGGNREIAPGKYRVDAGTAVFRVGGKAWRVSLGGEFSVRAGESAFLASADDREIVVTEFSV
jgi:hypothetical protein